MIAATCSIRNCSDKVRSRGMCGLHYRRALNGWNMHAPRQRTKPHPRNVLGMSLIEGKSIPVPEAGCWIWMGVWRRRGYGALSIDSRQVLAHRAAYEAFHGHIDNDLLVCHKCDTPSCVNPEHLFLGTSADNLRDAAEKGRTMHGEKNPGAKLKEEEAIAVFKSRMRYSDIAATYGISIETVRKIKGGHLWGRVTAGLETDPRSLRKRNRKYKSQPVAAG